MVSDSTSTAESWLSGSSPVTDVAFGSPGCCWVPRSKTFVQLPDVVFGPAVVSSMSRPPIIRWSALFGSISNGVENSGLVMPEGVMSLQVLPPSVVTDIVPPTYSS